MGKKKHKKKKTASGGKQSFSFRPLITGHVPVGQSEDVFNEHIQISKVIFDSLTGSQNGIL